MYLQVTKTEIIELYKELLEHFEDRGALEGEPIPEALLYSKVADQLERLTATSKPNTRPPLAELLKLSTRPDEDMQQDIEKQEQDYVNSKRDHE